MHLTQHTFKYYPIYGTGGGHLRTDGESLEFVNKSEGHHEINAECAAVFEQLKIRRKHRYIVYRIGEKEIEVETIGERGASYEDFKSKLPFTDSRYGQQLCSR